MAYKNKSVISYLLGAIPVEITSNEVSAELASNLTVVKSQQYDLVVSGTVQTYTIVINNPNISLISLITFSDIIPTGMTYVTGSFKVDGTVQTPTIVGQTISYVIASILASGTKTIEFKCTVT